jgi:hypothetical protein
VNARLTAIDGAEDNETHITKLTTKTQSTTETEKQLPEEL